MSDDEENPENVFDAPDATDANGPVRDAFSDLEREVRYLRSVLAKAEHETLKKNEKLRNLVLSEIRQRIYMRRLAATIGILIIGYMCYTMAHISHASMPPWWWPAPSPRSNTLAIVMFLAPATSVTAITIAFLFGVFRRFKDDDLQIDKAGLAGEVVKSQIGS